MHKELDDWYGVTRKQVFAHGGCGLLNSRYDGSLFKALSNMYQSLDKQVQSGDVKADDDGDTDGDETGTLVMVVMMRMKPCVDMTMPRYPNYDWVSCPLSNTKYQRALLDDIASKLHISGIVNCDSNDAADAGAQ